MDAAFNTLIQHLVFLKVLYYICRCLLKIGRRYVLYVMSFKQNNQIDLMQYDTTQKK